MSDYFVGNVNEVHLTGLYLEGGQTYHTVIQGCHAAGCYNVCDPFDEIFYKNIFA